MSNQDQNSSGVSRRGFLKGVGLGTAATGVLSAVKPVAEAATANSNIRGPGEIPISLKINGKSQKVNVEPRVTLLDTLRNRLDITGPKKVCDRATCGACTVLVDGKPTYSCTLLAVEAEGREITTVEGLGTPDKLSAVQKAFINHDAQQCGFCTPGFVTAQPLLCVNTQMLQLMTCARGWAGIFAVAARTQACFWRFRMRRRKERYNHGKS